MTVRRTGPRVASLAATAALVAVFVGHPARRAAADDETIRMRLFSFEEPDRSIATGTTVVWLNDEPTDFPVADGTHHVVADDESFDSGPLQPRQRFSFRFLKPGTVGFHCVIHPDLMRGSLEITGPAISPEPSEQTIKIVEPSQTDPDGWTFRPKEVTVPVGTRLTWRNEGAQEHSVTADDGSFDSGLLQPGQTFTYVVEEPATIVYHCTPHSWMVGSIKVPGAGGRAPPPKKGSTKTGGGPVVVEQPDRAGAGPATFNVAAVEPDPAAPMGWSFQPPSLTIRAGDGVVWRNAGASQHTVTADDGSFDAALAPGATFARTFDAPATVRFHCTPHPWMKGTILVVPASARGRLPEAPPPEDAPRDDGVGEQPPDGADEPADDGDPAASVRTPLALGTGGFLALMGLALVLPTVLERARRRRARVITLPDDAPRTRDTVDDAPTGTAGQDHVRADAGRGTR